MAIGFKKLYSFPKSLIDRKISIFTCEIDNWCNLLLESFFQYLTSLSAEGLNWGLTISKIFLKSQH